MGCGESKPEVAAGNTILSHSSSKHDPDSKTSKDVETIPEANTTDINTTNSSPQQQLEAKNEDKKDSGGAAVAADAKKIDENTAVKEGDIDEKIIDNGTASGKEADKENEAVKVVGENVIEKVESATTTVEEKNQNADITK